MSLNNINTNWNSYELSNSEIKIAIKFILENLVWMDLHFQDTIEENEISIEHDNIDNTEYLLALKAIVLLKENWAKNVYEIDKLDPTCKKKNSKINIQNQKINKVQEEVKSGQQASLNQAQQLSEQIKSWKDIIKYFNIIT